MSSIPMQQSTAELDPIVLEDLDRLLAGDIPWQEFSGRTVMISGASGFLPSWMLLTLLRLNDSGRLQRPCQIVGLARSRAKAERRFGNLLHRSDMQLLVQDVCDPIGFDGDVHFIIHGASPASPTTYGKDPVGTLLANTLGTHQLLKLAHAKRALGFLFMSSGEVYGFPAPAGQFILENEYGYLDPTVVRSCYGEGKRAGESLCASYAFQHDVPARIARACHTYGPGIDLQDGRVFADFLSDVVHGRDIVMRSDGAAHRTFCYVADATDAFFRILLRGEIAKPYNLGNDEGEVSIRFLAELLARLGAEQKLDVKVTRGAQPTDPTYMPSPIMHGAPDTTHLRQLGWKPTTSIEDGFRRTLKSLLRVGSGLKI